MRLVPFTVLLLVLTSSSLVAQKEPTLSLQKDKQTLFDFRLERPLDSATVSKSTQKMVFSKVFRKYLTDAARCNSQFDTSKATDPLKAARDAGQIVPAIADYATGSFTAPGQTQTLYVISVSECNASHADNFGTKRVAIFSGQQLIADLDVDFKGSVVLKSDLDGDGVNELLMASGDVAQGTVIEMASLLSFKGGRMNVIKDFGTVTEDSCASGFPGSSAKASVLSVSDVAPGKIPTLLMDNYTSGCKGAKRWRFLSAGKMPD